MARMLHPALGSAGTFSPAPVPEDGRLPLKRPWAGDRGTGASLGADGAHPAQWGWSPAL